MLFVIFVLSLIAGIVLMRCMYHSDAWWGIGLGLTIISIVCVVVSLFIIGGEHVTADGYAAANQERYEMLTCQYENNFYDNDNDIGKYQLLKDIQQWNEDLARQRELQNDFWIGIYVADIYDQFEFIDIGQYTAQTAGTN